MQGGLGLGVGGVARQGLRAVAALGHLHHHGRQLAFCGQPQHGLALQALVVGRIVLFAEQQHIGGEQGLQAVGPRSEWGAGGRGARAGTACQCSRGYQGSGQQQAGTEVGVGWLLHGAMLRG
ncbi:hypothetical protein D3C71_1746380 [compost metagenome]